MKRIGVLTGGGDAPGLNAAIKAVVVRAEREGYAVVGLARGWEGILDEGVDDSRPFVLETFYRKLATRVWREDLTDGQKLEIRDRFRAWARECG